MDNEANLMAYWHAKQGMKRAMEGFNGSKRKAKHGTFLPRVNCPVVWQTSANNDQKSSFWYNK